MRLWHLPAHASHIHQLDEYMCVNNLVTPSENHNAPPISNTHSNFYPPHTLTIYHMDCFISHTQKIEQRQRGPQVKEADAYLLGRKSFIIYWRACEVKVVRPQAIESRHRLQHAIIIRVAMILLSPVQLCCLPPQLIGRCWLEYCPKWHTHRSGEQRHRGHSVAKWTNKARLWTHTPAPQLSGYQTDPALMW